MGQRLNISSFAKLESVENVRRVGVHVHGVANNTFGEDLGAVLCVRPDDQAVFHKLDVQ